MSRLLITDFAQRQGTAIYCMHSENAHGEKPWLAYLEDLHGIRPDLNGDLVRDHNQTQGRGASPDAALDDLCRQLSNKVCIFPADGYRASLLGTQWREVMTPNLIRAVP